MTKALKKKELDTLKETLVEEKRKILRHLEDISESAEEGLTMGGGDSADIASLEINQASLQKIGKREETLLRKIDLALSKIDDGSYGLCENCGDPIGFARLTARPVAQLCIDCKTEQENVERKFSNREPTDDDSEGGAEESSDSE